MFRKKIGITLSVLASIAIMTNAQAEVTLNSVDVVEKNQVINKLKSNLVKIPGGTNLIDLETISTSKATLSDILKTEPGVMIQDFFGGNDQPRLNIRGSGIQSNPVNNGVNLLYDGTSINQPDGSFVIGLLNPSQHSAVSVYRGANAMSYGSSSLGGAINFTSKTGLDSDSYIEVQAGSHNTKNVNLGLGGANEKLDYFISAGFAESDGFRTLNTSQRKDAAINLGYQINDTIENRTLINYSDNFFDIPFVVPKDVAAGHPEAVVGDGYSSATTPYDKLLNVNNRKPHRDTQQIRASNKTTIQANDKKEYKISVFAEQLDDTFTDPLTHSVVESKNVGINLSTKGISTLVDEDKYEVSLGYNQGSMPIEYWTNNPSDGSKLLKFGDLDQDADNLALNVQYNVPVSKETQIVADLQYMKNTRDIDGTISIYNSKAINTINEKATFDAINPKLGVIHKLSEQSNVYANISRSMEAPTFNQLVSRTVSPAIAVKGANFAEALSGGNYVDLEEQKATTFEIGTKGSYEDSSWQVSYYHSQITDELITYADETGVSTITSNYTDKTTHQGIELGFNQILTQELSTNIVYNYNDFTFDGGVYDGNQIAGVPKQTIYLELAYNMQDKFFIAPNIKFQPDDNYADHSNSIKQDSFNLVGLKISYKPQDNLTLYTNLNNITDKTYETTYVVRAVSDTSAPTFLPGDGFNYTFGMKYTF